MQKGWIKLHRSLLDSDIWRDNQPFDMRSAWIDLLMLANHEDKNIIFDYQVVTVERGQFITSVRKLADRWKWGTERTLKFLRLLERLAMIYRDSNTHRTLITIVNYDKFQDWQDTGEDTIEDTDKDTTRTQPAHGSSTNNNDKNDKKNINTIVRFVKPTVDEVQAYCLERNNGINATDFVDFYESKGWMIGKNHMKDWKAAIRTWERKRKSDNNEPAKPKAKNKFGNFEQRKHNFSDLERLAFGDGE